MKKEHDTSVGDVEMAMARIRRRQTRAALAPADSVSPAVFRVLDAVSVAEAPTAGFLTRALGVDQPRASRLVAQAVSSGLLERAADQRDGRRAILRLTPAGADLLARARTDRRNAMASAMGDWTADERSEFARLLTRFVDALDHPAT